MNTFKTVASAVYATGYVPAVARALQRLHFDPRKKLSDLAARLVAVSMVQTNGEDFIDGR